MWFIVVALTLTGAAAQTVSQLGDRCSRDYACPPKYLKVAQQCYYFSKNRLTWSEAFFACQDLHGKLALVKNLHHSKLLRNFLDKVSIVDAERWIGGMYDWEQMLWKWGSSGLPIRYKDFAVTEPEDKEKLKWNCIALDPPNEYKWSPRSCLEEKHFICQTRLKKAHGSKTHKKGPYDPKKVHDLNEVLDPTESRNGTSHKESVPNGVNVDEDYDYDTAFAYRANGTTVVKGRKNKKNRKKYRVPDVKSGEPSRSRRNKSREDQSEASGAFVSRKNRSKDEQTGSSIETSDVHTKIYYSEQPKSPLQPRVLIEEVSFP